MKTYALLNDQDLLALYTTGDEQAFAEIYNRYHRSVYTYLLKFVKIPMLAEDLLHDVFITLWERREKIRVIQSFAGYLHRVARNHAINRIREILADTEMREEVLLQLEPISPVVQAEKISEYEKLMEQALQQMPPQRRKVFQLCREEGRTYNEAAQQLGLSRNTIKEHMVLAMRFLKGYIFEKGDIALLIIFLSGII
jgi:RNA polymerase sigma-70 factor (ECF subfamily)